MKLYYYRVRTKLVLYDLSELGPSTYAISGKSMERMLFDKLRKGEREVAHIAILVSPICVG
jgi:hypothetical protein